MISAESKCNVTCEAVSLDALQLDGGDVSSSSSWYSSCEEDSDYDCYCSANSVMGTPSVCSSITFFDDFAECDYSGSENFSLGARDEINCEDSMRKLRIGFCGDDGSDYNVIPKGVEVSNLKIGETTGPNIVKPKVQVADKLVNCSKSSFTTKHCEVSLMLAEQVPFNVNDDGNVEEGNIRMNTEEAIRTSDTDQQVDKPELKNSKFKFGHPLIHCNSIVDENYFNLATHTGNINAESFENLEQVLVSSNRVVRKPLDSFSSSAGLSEKNPMISKIENSKLNGLYDYAGSRLAQSNELLEPLLSPTLRDGESTVSTSSRDGSWLLVQHPMRIDNIEVVGTRQKKGYVSFSGRLAGVKEYTLYKIKVRSGEDHWEIERRYRDFVTLYRCMKSLYAQQGCNLPFPWSIVEKETRKIFGRASPGVIVQRRVLLQDCLQSILHVRFLSSPPGPLIWFLSPPGGLVSHSSFTRVAINSHGLNLLKTLSLIVEIPPSKSLKQKLEAQNNSCAGCHKYFDEGKTLIRDFVQTFGWGKPRLCEYTGQLFCSSCHKNETAVLPARVLHHWDFTLYPVSHLAKSYLDSINDQPLLCVTAVNPTLLSKVPALRYVVSVRMKLGTMLPYVICPFRSSVNREVGSRRYLLESSDFFTLRDLIDLSKGAFAVLPAKVETVSRKILKHITGPCLICCGVKQ